MATTTSPRAAGISPLDEPAAPSPASPGRLGRLRRLTRGRPTDPAWVRPALLGLLVATALLYLIDLGSSGWANSFYSAAVQAGTKSWKAFFFGSSDAANFITVDKPPAALWIMELSARIFGVNSWSILAPQALEGVASVGLLYLTVRRTFSAGAGILAGAVLALTPVATLMFRFNNPDALLVLLLIGATYATLRAVQSGKTGWLLLAGSLVGFGFITKMLQALVVLPALGSAYLLAGPPRLRRRIVQLLAAGAAVVVAAGWWVAAVQLTPAADRPYVGGSQNNSLFNLIFGYNGFGRLTGNETGSVGGGGGGGGTGMWGATGIGRMFGSEFGTQISWLLPAALGAIAVGIWLTRRARRTDPTRAAFVAWGGSLVVTGLVFSLGKGIIHPYYSIALAPAIGALVGAAASLLWARRHHLAARIAMAVGVAGTAVWADILLRRTPGWNSWLQLTVLIVGLVAAIGLVLGGLLRRRGAIAIAAVAVAVSLAAPGAYSIATAASTESGAIPTAGPSSGGGFGGGFGHHFAGGGRAGAGRAGAGRAGFGQRAGGGFGGGGFAPPGGFGGQGGTAAGATGGAPGAFGGAPGGGAAGAPGVAGVAGGRGAAAGGGGGGGFGGGGAGGLLNATTPSAAFTAALKANASKYTWVAATVGSETASGYQLASGEPVMALGGFNGTDPYPTLAAFEKLVAAGRVHYFIAGGGFGGGGRGGSSASDTSAISTWVEAHYTATTIGGTTVYDLSVPASTA